MKELDQELERLASETGFSGAIRIERGDRVDIENTYGFANRGYGIPNRIDTQFGLASGTKAFTALAVCVLLEEGALELSTPVRSLLRDDLPRVDGSVTIEHLLSHRSGIGDYLHGDTVYDYMLSVPVHELATTEQYLPALDGNPQHFPPGERFLYCNAGYVLLALIAERASGVPYHVLVLERVCRPAGMVATDFLRSDELPGTAALGYLHVDGLRTNLLHLPVRGCGDGGIYSTVSDLSAFWKALFAGQIVSAQWVHELPRTRSEVTRRWGDRYRCGLGFWHRESTETVVMDGGDAGVSFRSAHDPHRELTQTVVSNTTEGALPLIRFLEERLEL